jgi:signal transduction histidine kinase
VKTKHVRHNPLGVAVVILYIGCGGGHLVHTLMLLDVPLGLQTAGGAAVALEYRSNMHMWVIDILTAMAGVAYWLSRKRFPALVSGAAVFEDLRTRQQRALEIHDNVIQGISRVKMAMDLEEEDETREAMDETLKKAREIITDLLAEEELKPGRLRRRIVRTPGRSKDV